MSNGVYASHTLSHLGIDARIAELEQQLASLQPGNRPSSAVSSTATSHENTSLSKGKLGEAHEIDSPMSVISEAQLAPMDETARENTILAIAVLNMAKTFMPAAEPPNPEAVVENMPESLSESDAPFGYASWHTPLGITEQDVIELEVIEVDPVSTVDTTEDLAPTLSIESHTPVVADMRTIDAPNTEGRKEEGTEQRSNERSHDCQTALTAEDLIQAGVESNEEQLRTALHRIGRAML